jgi:hypothetical protein
MGDWVMIPPYNGPAMAEQVQIELGNSEEYQLYNLKQDPGEQRNLAATQPEKLKEMVDAFAGIRGALPPEAEKLELK